MNTNEPQDETEAEIHVNNVYKGKGEDGMDYELYKKLKDMGFEQEGSGFGEPTLSSLIEACGEAFDNLEKREDIYLAFGSSKDTANIKIDPFLGGGKTPQEAVAKLWIELNK